MAVQVGEDVLRPDWVCEIISPSNARTNRVEKLRAYHRNEVPHSWLVDPKEQTLTVLRYGSGGSVVVLTATAAARPRHRGHPGAENGAAAVGGSPVAVPGSEKLVRQPMHHRAASPDERRQC